MVKKTNLPVNYNEQLAKEAAEIQKRIAAPSGDRIRFKANTGFILPDGSEGDTLGVVILDFVSSNMFYDSPFDRENPQPPGCFAIGLEPTTLVPSDNSPNKQSEACAVCPNNQFGSGTNGKGKACKNTRLLAVTPIGSDDENPPIWIMQVPPTGLKSFDAYVKNVADKLRISPIGVHTLIKLDPNLTYASPRFAMDSVLDKADLGIYMERRDEARARLLSEPDVSQYAPPKPTKARVGIRR